MVRVTVVVDRTNVCEGIGGEESVRHEGELIAYCNAIETNTAD
jgi:hypothetical protein